MYSRQEKKDDMYDTQRKQATSKEKRPDSRSNHESVSKSEKKTGYVEHAEVLISLRERKISREGG
jgi:hypothetical protein